MTRKPPDWADSNPKYDVWVRIALMKAQRQITDTIEKHHSITPNQEDILDQILIWFMETGTPQNLTGLSLMTGRSDYLVRQDVRKLVEAEAIIARGKKLWPSLWFARGSVTSPVVVDTAREAVKEVERLLQEREANGSAHRERERILQDRLAQLIEITGEIDRDRHNS